MPSSERWLLRSVEVGGEVVDCRVAGGHVVELSTGLAPLPGEEVVDGGRGALIPGLADHHVHVLALAAARGSVDLAGAVTLVDAPVPDGTDWLRVVGAGVELRRKDIDERWGDRPVRVQHRSGALWTLSTAAVELLGQGLTNIERESGQVWRADDRLRHLLDDVDDGLDARLVEVGRDLAAYGITQVMDATPTLDAAGLARVRVAIPQRVVSMADGGEGPRKIVLPDHASPDYERLRKTVRHWHGLGRPVAIHAVSETSLAMAVAVYDDIGPLVGDRVEHAAVCNDAAARRIADLGLTVVTQPTVFARHGETFEHESSPEDRPLLWRHAGLVALGVRVVVSSDAPYGDADPTATIRACATRPVEGVDASAALKSYLLSPGRLDGAPRKVSIGADASLCLLREPLEKALHEAAAGGSLGVRATFASGTLIGRSETESL